MKLFATFLLLIIISSNLYSQEDTTKNVELPELTVSSNKAVKGITPITFSEIKSEVIELTKSNTDIPFLLNSQPSVISYSDNGNWLGYSNLTIRGFDQRRIAVYINGIPQNDPEDHNLYWINYSDLYESIGSMQVQRGAGVANYGPSSIGGSINIETSNFVDEAGVKIQSGVGYQEFGANDQTLLDSRFNSRKNSIEISSGLIDNKYAIYGKYTDIKSYGYRQGTWVDLHSYFIGAVRFDGKLTTRVNFYGGGQFDGLGYSGLSRDLINGKANRLTNFNNGEVERFNSPHFEILNDYDLNDDMSFSSKLFFFEGKGYFDYSGLGWADGLFGINPENGFDEVVNPANSMIRGYVGNKQWGWIPSYTLHHNNGTLLIGASLRFHSANHWGRILSADNLPDNYDTGRHFFDFNSSSDNYDLFVKETYNVSDELSVTGDISVNYKTYSIGDQQVWGNLVQEGDLFEVEYLFFNPRFGMNYKINDNSGVYLSIAHTTRPPRRNSLYDAAGAWFGNTPQFNTDSNGNLNFDDPIAQPEKLLDVELGTNYSGENYNLSANMYLMEFTDELVFDGSLNAYGSPSSTNVPKSRHMGIELAGSVSNQIDKNMSIELQGNLTVSSNKVIEAEVVVEDMIIDLNDNQLAGMPNFMTYWALSYNFYDFNINSNVKYVGEMKTNNLGDLYGDANTLDEYIVMNLNTSYLVKNVLGSDLRVMLTVNNLLNEFYTPYGIGGAFFPAAERSFYFGFELRL